MSATDIDVADKRWHEEGLVETARTAAAAALEGHDGARASLRLTDDAEMRELNRVWRSVDQPTNVLAFPSASTAPDIQQGELGDVAIGFETVTREAMERGIPCAHHLAHLIIHGILHLAGHDHEIETEAVRMEAIERERLAKIGIASPYESDGSDG